MNRTTQTTQTVETLADLLLKRVELAEHGQAYGFLPQGEEESESLTYGGLRRRAARAAGVLAARFEAGDRIILAFPAGLDFLVAFFACQLSGMIAVPVGLPKRNRSNERFLSILKDCDPRCLLTLSSLKALIEGTAGAHEGRIEHLSLDGEDFAQAPQSFSGPSLEGEAIAYLQYTSGSISLPKGVIITHANILSNCRYCRFVEEAEEDFRSLTWLPHFHDMGLVEGLLHPLFSGVPAWVMPPPAFLQKPLRWLRAISRHRITASGGPNFAFDLCVAQAADEDVSDLDLSGWKVAYNGAEPVRQQTLRDFAQTFAPYGFSQQSFYPVFGLAEATLVATSGRRRHRPAFLSVERSALEQGRVVPRSAAAADNCTLAASGLIRPLEFEEAPQVAIVDPQSRARLGPMEVGEIWLRGPGIAGGYWKRGEESRETFQAWIPGEEEGPYLRTGDLGFHHEGHLYVTGRLKETIIVQGRNLYPQDLELLAERAGDFVRPGASAAFAVKEDGEEKVVLVCEVEREKRRLPLQEPAQRIADKIAAELEVELKALAFILPGALPKTSSGKIRRLRCRSLYLEGGLKEVFRTSFAVPEAGTLPAGQQAGDLKEALRGMVARFSGAAEKDVLDSAPLSQYVNDSLAAVRLSHQLEAAFSVSVPLTLLLGSFTLAEAARQLEDLIEGSPQKPAPASPAADDAADSPVALTPGQEALWFLQKMAPDSVAYNISRVVEIQGSLQPEAFKRALDSLIALHPVLRTRFGQEDAAVLQSFDSGETVEYRWSDRSDSSSVNPSGAGEELRQEGWQPFHLEEGPLVRVHLLRLAQERHLLLISAHHIVIDLWSFTVLLRDWMKAYQALAQGRWPQMAAPGGLYAAFARAQNHPPEEDQREVHKIFWLKELEGAEGVLSLPLDAPRPKLQTFPGAALDFALERPQVERLAEEASLAGTTLFSALLSIYTLWLNRLTGQETVLVGVPSSGRGQAVFADSLGYFVNPLAIRGEVSPRASWRRLLRNTGDSVLRALEHQDYPFALLVEALGAKRDPSRSPLFQVMMGLEDPQEMTGLAPLALGQPGGSLEMGGLRLTARESGQQGAQFDLNLAMVRHEGGIRARLTYNSDLLEEETVQRWIGNFMCLLDSALAHPDEPVSQLSALPPAEARAVLKDWNATQEELGPLLPLPRLIDRQAAATPDRIAVSIDGAHLTYRQLRRLSDSLAARLQALGLEEEGQAAVCLERSLELPVVLLAVMKCGASYVPVGTDYPPARIAQYFENAQPTLVISASSLKERFKEERPVFLEVQTLIAQGLQDARRPQLVSLDLDNAAYTIFTSGSTGRPKGVVNTHLGIVNRLLWMQNEYKLSGQDRVLQKTPYTFDVSVWEFFWPLMTGAQLVMARPEGHKRAEYLREAITRHEVTLLHFVPSMLDVFLREPEIESLGCVRQVVCSGEALSLDLQKRFHQRWPARLDNLYGPTEAAIDVTAWHCREEARASSVPIGFPISNTQIHLLDEHFNPVMRGAAGMLYIGGLGLARGYAGSPDLTAAAFRPHPFGDQPGQRLYRTGDYASYRADRAIDFLGRRDHQVKIRGVRIELQEIEECLRTHPAVDAAIVIADPDGPGHVRLVGYYLSSQDGLAGADLKEWLAARLPEAMVPTWLVALSEIPLLENGKVNRKALPKPETSLEERRKPFVAPSGSAQEALAEIWSEVLEQPRISVNDNFFDVGGDSLLVVRVAARANQRGLGVTVEQLYQLQTIERIAQHLSEEGGEAAQAPYQPFSLIGSRDGARIPAEIEDAMPLSKLQEGMVFHIDNSDNYICYVASVHLRARFRRDLMEKAVAWLFQGHPYLRISFDYESYREPLQVVHSQHEIPLSVSDLRHLSGPAQEAFLADWLEEEKKNRFRWSKPPLVRFNAHLRDEDRFQITITEVTLDGWSIAVLLSELCRCYRSLIRGSDSLPSAPELPYGKFVQLEREACSSQEHDGFWGGKLEGPAYGGRLPRWPLACRSSDTTVHSRRTVLIEQPTLDGLKRLARQIECPLKSLFLAAHLKVVGFLSGDNRLLTELISNGRLGESGGDLSIGLFTNTVPLCVEIGQDSWIDLIRRTRQAEQETIPYRRYPFALIKKRFGHQPLFETAFNYTHFHVYRDLLEAEEDFEILDVRSFDQTYYHLTAYFNLEMLRPGLSIDLDYNPTILSPQQMEWIAGYYTRTLQAMADAPQSPCWSFSPLQARETVQMETWSRAQAVATAAPPLFARFDARAAAAPHAVAVVQGDAQVSYGELDRRSRQVAQRLMGLGAGPGVRVGLAVDRSPLMIAALMGVLRAGAVLVPLDPAYPLERLRYMMRDSGVAVLLTQDGLAAELADEASSTLFVEDLQAQAASPSHRALDHDSQQAAYCLYTSGATGQPKGVVVSRHALSSFVEAALERYAIDGDDRVLQFAALSFDAAWEEIFPVLAAGGCLVLKSQAMMEGFGEFLEESRRHQITVWDLPTAFWHHLVDDMAARRRRPSASLRLLIIGGERALGGKAAAWLEAAGREIEFLNTYGPTEATVVATSYAVGQAREVDFEGEEVAIGAPLPNACVHVLDENGCQVPVGRSGELHIGGQGLALGYHRRPALTAQAFVPDHLSGRPGERLYRSGDWARWLPDGNLEFAGRKDAQIKVRGFRIEPEEVERAIEEFAGISQAAVTPLRNEDGSQVLAACLVHEDAIQGGQGRVIGDLRQFLKLRLPAYMIPSRFALASQLPLTASSKVDRQRLAEWMETLSPEVEAPSLRPLESPVESVIASIFKERFELPEAGPETNFFEIGGDSLSAMQIVSQVKTALGVEISVRSLFENASLRALSALVEEARRPGLTADPIQPGTPEEQRPLSPAQERLWFLHKFNPRDSSYNVPALFRIEGALDVDVLEHSFQHIVERHQVLKTRFVDRGSAPELVINHDFHVNIRRQDLRGEPQDLRASSARTIAEAEAGRHFDLERDDLIRVSLIRLDDDCYDLIVLMHHVVTDEWCARVFLNELRELYESAQQDRPSQLAEPPFQYWDFARWQRARQGKDHLKSLKEYWAAQLRNHPDRIRLPYDRQPGAETGNAGKRMHFQLEADVLEGLKAVSSREKASLFMTLLGLYKLLFYSTSGQRDLLVGSPISGRSQPGTEGLIGFFANLMVLRSQIDEEESFQGFLAALRTTVLEAFDHQEYSFAQLVSDLNPQRSLTRAPLVQVIFGLWGLPVEEAAFGGLQLTQQRLHNQGAKYDLEMQFVETQGRLSGFLEYNTGLFKEQTIARLIDTYKSLARAVAKHPGLTLGELRRQVSFNRKGKNAMKTQTPAFGGKSRFKKVRRKAVSLSNDTLVKSEPLKEGSTLPLAVRPAVSEVNLSEWISDSRQWVEDHLIKHGGLLFRGFQVGGLEGFQSLARQWEDQLLEYKERSTPRTGVGGDVYTSTEYPADQTIPQHNENSYTSAWPLKILFYCQQPSESGGETPLADSRLVYQSLPAEVRRPFEEKGVLYVRNFGHGVDLSWQEAFQTEDAGQVEDYCSSHGIEFEWLDGGKRLRTRQKRPAVAAHPRTGERLWFNQAHLFNVASLDEPTREALLNTYQEMDLPRQTFFGDGSSIESWMLEAIDKAYQDNLVAFPWQAEDLLLLDNMLITHGRRPYGGKRKVYVAMAEPWDQV